MARSQFSNTVEVSGGSVLGLNSLYGNLTVGAVAVELKIGLSPLVSRTGVFIQASPNNSDAIYIGLDNTVTSSKAFFALNAGSAVSVDLDTDNDIHLYAYSPSAGQKLHLCEVKK